MKKTPLLYAALIVYAAAVFFLSTSKSPEEMPELWQIDKIYHFGAYLIMGVLAAMALRRPSFDKGFIRSSARVIGLAFAATFLFGALIEVFQYYIPGRNAEAFDAAANGTGGFIGALAYERFRAWKGGAG